jgi:anti-anti-sigma regulatory factor
MLFCFRDRFASRTMACVASTVRLTGRRCALRPSSATVLMSRPCTVDRATRGNVGIFSFLKKKNEAAGVQAAERMHADVESKRARQRDIARATAAKIDEIELEMTSAIFDDDAWSGGRRVPGGVKADPDIPELTDILVDTPDAAATPSQTPAVEEAAILHANGQTGAAEQVLLASLADTGHADRLAWRMLLDLYQIAGREQDFDSLAIDYASRFETSPPAYQPAHDTLDAMSATDAGIAFTGPTPTASLSGMLDDGAADALARIRAPSPSPIVRIEFHGMTGATAQGSALLLGTLQQLRQSGRELVLAGADSLIRVLQAQLAVGERSASQAPWLLLLELFLLTDREKAFEETAMDYCITFEVSPPSFEQPARAALRLQTGAAVAGDHFLLPPVVEHANTAVLLAALETHAARPGPLILDCSRLARIDYPAANALGHRLRLLAEEGAPSGRRIALRDLNYPVAVLLRLLGTGEFAELATRK